MNYLARLRKESRELEEFKRITFMRKNDFRTNHDNFNFIEFRYLTQVEIREKQINYTEKYY